jgi:hypothetical protein
MRTTIKVTADDIREGSKQIMSNTHCIIGRAANRVLQNASVGYLTLSFSVEGPARRVHVNLPKSAKRVQDYYLHDDHVDSDGKIVPRPRPFSFRISY